MLNGAICKIIPHFLIAIKTKSKEIHWDDRTTGITNVNGKGLFDKYHIITETGGITTKDACTNDRAVHNNCALYKVLQTSITGGIRSQMFSHIANVPILDDVVSLFFHMTKIIMSSSLHISMSAFNKIFNFNLKDYNYHITNNNTQSNQLFFFANTIRHTLSPE